MPDGGASIWLPILIGGATATATTAVGAYASGKAADQQEAAGERALQFQRQMYGEAVTRTAPFVHSGVAANNALQKLMGLSGGGPLAMAPDGPPGATDQGDLKNAVDRALPTSKGGLWQNPLDRLRQGADPPVIDVRAEDTGGGAGSWNPLTTLMSATPAPAADSPFGRPTATAPAADAGSMVMMVSPDGNDRKAVPRDQVAFYQRRGAVIAPAAAEAA